MRAAEHAENSSFGAACAVGETAAALNARQDVIPMHGVAQGIAADEKIAVQILSWRIGHDEPVTVAMRHEAPGKLIHLGPRRRSGFPPWL